MACGESPMSGPPQPLHGFSLLNRIGQWSNAMCGNYSVVAPTPCVSYVHSLSHLLLYPIKDGSISEQNPLNYDTPNI